MTYSWHQTTLKQLTEARRAGRLPHALLFNAETGCGHIEFINAFAKSLLCLNVTAEGMACGDCRSCEVFQATAHPDFVHIKTPDDKNIINVEQIRSLNHFLELSRSYSPVRVALISDADAMNINAANSLLKTLEEPVANTHILLFSHHSSKLLPTIRSRCQQIRLPLPTKSEAVNWLEQGGQHTESAHSLLALASGRPLYAIQLIDGKLAEKQAIWHQQLLSTLKNEQAIAAVSSEWSKQDKAELLDWQIRLLNHLLKEKAVGASQSNPELSKAMAASDLWRLHDALLKLKALAAHPLNPQLFAENMLSLWKNS